MHKTPFSKRCEILGTIWVNYSDDAKRSPIWTRYFEIYELALPLAYSVWTGVATVKRGKEIYIDEAWDDLCRAINVDADAKYNSIEEIFAASPNDPMPDEDEE